MFNEQEISNRIFFCVVVFLFGLGLTAKIYAFGVEAAMEEKKPEDDASVSVTDNSKIDTKVVAAAENSESNNADSLESQHIGNPDSIEAGRQKYGNTCLFCHGAKGVGARAPTLVDNGFAPGGVNTNEYFITTIKYGRPGTIMGSYEGTLTETEMWQIIAYLRDQSEKKAMSQ